ncbi:hypothetical protein [Microbacterium oleivorans]|uniref:Uncharacterized protein n=1 Tax=Microbacterium oleivorans TaxID=273677 RepID=A0A4R5YGL0_9MICO|nr:hypothetical protein [Microbacterium oleivorans]TDL43955.1 hypothetical protein E2R54_12320 [Microbacterium oleivorans]
MSSVFGAVRGFNGAFDGLNASVSLVAESAAVSAVGAYAGWSDAMAESVSSVFGAVRGFEGMSASVSDAMAESVSSVFGAVRGFEGMSASVSDAMSESVSSVFGAVRGFEGMSASVSDAMAESVSSVFGAVRGFNGAFDGLNASVSLVAESAAVSAVGAYAGWSDAMAESVSSVFGAVRGFEGMSASVSDAMAESGLAKGGASSAASLEEVLARPDLDEYISRAVDDEQAFQDILKTDSLSKIEEGLETVRFTIRDAGGELFQSASIALALLGGLSTWVTNAAVDGVRSPVEAVLVIVGLYWWSRRL